MTTLSATRRILWQVGPVLAGLLANIVLSVGTDALLQATDVFPPRGGPMADTMFLLPLGFRTTFRIVASYVAARLALPLRHAFAPSRRVVKDDAERVAPSRADAAHAVPEVDAIEPARAPHRAMMDGDDHRVALAQRQHHRS